jgi:hypothetical protein
VPERAQRGAFLNYDDAADSYTDALRSVIWGDGTVGTITVTLDF